MEHLNGVLVRPGNDYILYCMNNYRSLPKEHPWAEHLTSLPKRGVGTLSTISAFDHERAPMSCLQRLEAFEANNWMQNNVQQNHQQLRSQRHTTTLWTIRCDGEHSVAHGAHRISYVLLRKDALYYFRWSITWHFLPGMIVLEAVLLKLHAKLALAGWALIQVNFDPIQEIGPKVGGGCSFMSGSFFARLR